MGDNKLFFRGYDKQQYSDGMDVFDIAIGGNFNLHKSSKKMIATKVLMWASYLIGVPVYTYALFLNIGTYKSDILFLCALSIFFINGYYKIKKSNQALEQKAIEIEMKRRELKKTDTNEKS